MTDVGNPTIEQLTTLAEKLTYTEKLRLLENIIAMLKIQGESSGKLTARDTLYGALAHLGPAPSSEDIDEVRREIWTN
ncbi:MAG: hypothetical protein DPW16_00310 [Chloroflexi bacterium]|nr:hypothetical protein [Chloroflexota bacterium]